MTENGNNTRKIAIACQGGGSHTAFTAGALMRLLDQVRNEREYEIVALSGTSGGAICAFLAWNALLGKDGEQKAIKLLHSFWTVDNSAYLKFGDPGSIKDVFTNYFVSGSALLQETGLHLDFNPYYLPSESSYWRDRLERAIEDRVREIVESRAGEVPGPEDPQLFIGAVNTQTGEFWVFKSHKMEDEGFVFNDDEEDRISVDVVLVSAAIPTVFQATHTGKAVYWDDSDHQGPPSTYVDEGVYWDGLYSQNPPIRDLRQANPDEIWVVQINPEEIGKEPKTTAGITDRRNELTGNTSLNQELFFVRNTNEMVRRYRIDERIIKVRRIELSLPLDAPSKLDRSPWRIQRLMTDGERQAEHFLKALPFQVAFEAPWEKEEKKAEDVLDLFTDDAVVTLVPPSVPPDRGLTYEREATNGERLKIEDLVGWCLAKDLVFEQTRDYRMDDDREGRKSISCWMLATMKGFRDPIKCRARMVVRDDRDNKIESLTFWPLSWEAVRKLEEAIGKRHSETSVV